MSINKRQTLLRHQVHRPVFAFLIASCLAAALYGQSGIEPNLQDKFSAFIYADQTAKESSLDYIKENWQASYAPLLIELIRLTNDPWFQERVIPLLEQRTGASFGNDFYRWLQWLWERAPVYPYYYADFKAELYSHLDPVFETYFLRRTVQSLIRLDEVVWGGVRQDGIPPLRYPRMIVADDAEYLADSDIVFGLQINGDTRAFPKRILAWHEFFVDKVGGVAIAGVYCTLCGTVIAYDMTHEGTVHDLGTSGFLYRSNKLMYDAATQSLWSTIKGIPVVGPLADKGIRLATYPVVTTTWGEWKARHPGTTVLSMDTGHRRDYSEGAAYRTYFGSDDLMFPVPKNDRRLKNKNEVLIVRAPGFEQDPLAISIAFLKRKHVYFDQIGGTQFVVITAGTGASRVYQAGGVSFGKYKNDVLLDNDGTQWEIHETHLAGPNGKRLERIPAHRVFWFAWYNTYPDGRLVR